MIREGAGTSNFILFSFVRVCVSVCVFFFVVVLFVVKKCPMLSCFVNFIFDSFVISYWMYFVCDRKKKKLKEQKLYVLLKM